MCSIHLPRRYLSIEGPSPRKRSLRLPRRTKHSSGSSAQSTYLDKDVAYLLGLIVARGHFKRSDDFTKVVVSILRPKINASRPAASTSRLGASGRLGALDLRDRLEELVQTSPRVSWRGRSGTIHFSLANHGMALRNLLLLCGRHEPRARWELHPSLLRAPRQVRIHFLRGLLEASGTPSSMTNLEFRIRNRTLAQQVRQLFQATLAVFPLQVPPDSTARAQRLRVRSRDLAKLGLA
jgi:hypothetical protein